jgi:AcrR family transcriptional regulator
MKQELLETGWRGSPDLWLDAAQEALLDGGVDAVRILPLGQRLKLSRTSFYWFFKSREELLEGLLARWRDKNTGTLIRRAQAPAASVAEAMLNVFDCWLDPTLFDARFEMAVRGWAVAAPAVLDELRRADQDRLRALSALLERYGHPSGHADVRARTIYLTQIGYISMQVQEELATRMARIPDYVMIFTGSHPTAAELARFHARHGFSG